MNDKIYQARLYGMVSRGVRRAWIDEAGDLRFEMTDGAVLNLGHIAESGGIRHSWDGTVLTVTTDGGSSSADLQGPKGDKGDQGERGEKGDAGDTGPQGPAGADGKSFERFLVGISGPDDNGAYSADKSFAQVRAAIDGGADVSACCTDGEGIRYELCLYAYRDTAVVFHRADGEGQDSFFTLYSDDSLKMTAMEHRELPVVSESDDGLVLQVQEGRWKKGLLPVAVDEAGYTRITGLPHVTAAAVTRTDGTVTVALTMENGSSRTAVLTVDESDRPVTVTVEDKVCAVSWEGFD